MLAQTSAQGLNGLSFIGAYGMVDHTGAADVYVYDGAGYADRAHDIMGNPPEFLYGGSSSGKVNDELPPALVEEKKEEEASSPDDGATNSGSYLSFENILNILGLASGSTEEIMKAILVTEIELREYFIQQGLSTKKIDKIISRSGTTGGIAHIGGRLLFWGEFGSNLISALNNPTIENLAINSADTFFSGLATYGGIKGIIIGGVYYMTKQNKIITVKSLDEGIVKTNADIRFTPGLSPSPIIWNW